MGEADRVRETASSLRPTRDPLVLQDLAWAQYRVYAIAWPPSFRDFVKARRPLLEARLAADAALRRGRTPPPWSPPARMERLADDLLDAVDWLCRFVWPGAFATRLGRPKEPRLPPRRRLRGEIEVEVGGRRVRGYPRYRTDAPYLWRGDNEHRGGWYSYPFWDDGWKAPLAELEREWAETDRYLAERAAQRDRIERHRGRTSRPRRRDDDGAGEAGGEGSDEDEDLLQDSLEEIVADAIADAQRDRGDAGRGSDAGSGGSGSSGDGGSSRDHDNYDYGDRDYFDY